MKKNTDVYRMQIGDDFYSVKSSIPGIIVYVRDIHEGLQISWVFHEYTKHGITRKLVEQGIRLPEIECIYHDYEESSMRQMNFKNPRPRWWLTYWRDVTETFESMHKEHQWDDILEEDERLGKYKDASTSPTREHALELLQRAELPTWASLPRATILAIRSIISNSLFGENACDNFRDRYSHIEDVVSQPENVERFCQWFLNRETDKVDKKVK